MTHEEQMLHMLEHVEDKWRVMAGTNLEDVYYDLMWLYILVLDRWHMEDRSNG